MVTIAIVAILATVAVPSFRDIIVNNRLASQANALVSALTLARSEAVKQNQTATVCVSTNGTTCTTTSATCAAGIGWACGWLVWVDSDGSGAMQASEIIRVGGALTGDSKLSGSAASLQYLASGLSTATTTTTFSLCYSTQYPGRTISISPAGRVNTVKYTPSSCP
jgi:type IV fimbrial biogenesis protein FimT